MRKIALFLACCSCLGHWWQVEASLQQGKRLPNAQKPLHRSESQNLASHDSALHPLKALTMFLSANNPLAAFNTFNSGSVAASPKWRRVAAWPSLSVDVVSNLGLTTCENCGATYEVEDSAVGKAVRCAVCNEVFRVKDLTFVPKDKDLVDYPEDIKKRYEKKKKTEGFDILVRNLIPSITKADLMNHFEQCGPVLDVDLPTDQFGRPKLLGNVVMKRWVDGVTAISLLDNSELSGQRLRVEEGDHYSKRVSKVAGDSGKAQSVAASMRSGGGSAKAPVQSFRSRQNNAGTNSNSAPVQSFRRNANNAAPVQSFKRKDNPAGANQAWKHKNGKKLTEFKVGELVNGVVTNVIDKATFIDFGGETDGVMPREATPNRVPKKKERFENLVIAKIDLDRNRAVLLPNTALKR